MKGHKVDASCSEIKKQNQKTFSFCISRAKLCLEETAPATVPLNQGRGTRPDIAVKGSLFFVTISVS